MYLVSVITPVFNCLSLVRQVVECVASQSLEAVEHIVVDDGSTDGTLEELRKLQLEFSNLLVFSQYNLGAGAARNLGIEKACGRYIAFLDSDDRWHPEKLSIQIDFMEVNGVEFSYGDYTAVDSRSGQLLATYRLPDRLRYEELLNGCPIGCLTVVYNQETFGKKYMPLCRRGQDWGLWLSLTRSGVVAKKYPGVDLAFYNIRTHSLSKSKIKKLIDVYNIYVKEEKISRLKSLLHLYRHIKYASLKNYSR